MLTRDDTDRELPFRQSTSLLRSLWLETDWTDQEANFNYLTGCLVPDATVLITFSADESSIRHTLYIPHADPLVTMWSVAPPTLDEAKGKFESDEITYTTDLDQHLSSVDGTLFTLPLTTEYPALPSCAQPIISKGSKHETHTLRRALHRARLVKTEYEVELIREANRISSGAHEVLMRELGRYAKKREVAGDQASSSKERSGKEGLSEWEVESEGDAEAVFVAACRRMG